MSQTIRQSELFAAQDWQVLYKAFTQINFNASDPPSINAALREYLQANYPEDFNDWIESSEFVAIIDLLSWIAGTLAFKTDINARENFLETAEARESILRLARFLSYNAKRNQPARGLLKLVSVTTDEPVADGFGVNLQNRTISWNDPNDSDWFERMITVLNSAFVKSNPFGLNLKNGVIAGVKTQLYRFNSRFGDSDFNFTRTINGTDMPFEFVNTDFDTTLGFTERAPTFDNAVHMLYRVDGRGNTSANTGFFMAFKQGTLQRQVFQIATPVENQTLDINVNNINQSDVWVQTLDDTGAVTTQWEKVPAVFSNNITFNDISPAIRDIFSVVTRDNDQVTIRFADGRFGSAPVGYIRVWYRTSNGQQYLIRPADMQQVSLRLRYTNSKNVPYNITMTFSLQESVSNSAARESEEDIRRRAPQVYAAQDRMVSGEDYNTYPMQSNQAIKIKALNRIYSGQSRFADLTDPTGTYRDLNVFSDDGMFYKEIADRFAEVPLSDNRTPADIINNYVQPMLRTSETTNFVNDYLVQEQRLGNVAMPISMVWHKSTDNTLTSTGWFSAGNQYLTPGATLLMSVPGMAEEWVTIVTVFGSGLTQPGQGLNGPVTLAANIQEGAQVTAIIPPYLSALPTATQTSLIGLVEQKLSFSLWFDHTVSDSTQHWFIQEAQLIKRPDGASARAIRVMTCEFLSNQLWRFRAPGIRFVFESEADVQFYFDGARTVNQTNGQPAEDLIRVLKINEDLNGPMSLQRDYDLTVDTMIVYSDGYQDPRRITVKLGDSDQDGYPDDPDTYYRIIDDIQSNTYLFWARVADGTYVPYTQMTVYEQELDRITALNVLTGTVAFQVNSDVAPNSFWRKTDSGWTRDFRSFRFGIGRGLNVAASWYAPGNALLPIVHGDPLKFQWKHFAGIEHRVDPAKSNIIDIFVLTTEYDFLVRQWIADGARLALLPAPPTELQLRLSMSDLETSKTFSDDIIWRPVRYRFLFGAGADPALRAKIKIVKLPNATLSDGEIKARVITAINSYFQPKFWDFGETFYFTELSAYIHQQLANNIASCALVPEAADAAFGDGFEIRCRSDELFISTAQVNDVTIIDANTPDNLRII